MFILTNLRVDKMELSNKYSTIIIFIGFIIMLVLVLLWLTRPRTSAFLKSQNGITEMIAMDIGGIKQGIIIRGAHRNNPLLLFLNGGPGLAETGLFRHYNHDLEKNFVVVYWDQRGTGRSYHGSLADRPMSIDQFVSDIFELANYLLTRFHKEKLYLVAHSWGTLIGMLAIDKHPELFHAYVGTGQCANMPAGEELSYEFTLNRAREENNQKAIKELEKIGKPVKGVYQSGLDGTDMQRKWLLYFGGAVYGRKDWSHFIKILLTADEYSLWNRFNLFRGMYLDVKDQMVEREFLKFDLMKTVPSVNVPVYFFLGRHDYQIPSVIAAEYFEQLKAPQKELVWFEQSAHSPCFEEPGKFNRLIVEKLLRSRSRQQ